MELPGQTLETFPLLAQERGTIEREWVSISGKNIAEIRAKLSAAILWLVGKVTFDFFKIFQWTGLADCDKMRLLCGTADMSLVSLRCSGDKCGLCILYSHSYLSPGLSLFALLTDTSSVMQTRPSKSSVSHKDHSQLCISWRTSTEGEPLPGIVIHSWLVQWVIYHVKGGVAPPFLCMLLFLKPIPVSGARARSWY